MTANEPDSTSAEMTGEGERSNTDSNTAREDGETHGTATALRDGTTPSAGDDPLDHAARAEILAEENRRLRSEFARAQQSKYRRTAYGLGIVGLLAVGGGILFPDGREVLFVLGATGLFGAILTLYLTPGQFVSADVGERVYAAMAANETAIATELGLSETRLYLPDDGNSARLYIPQRSESGIPDDLNRPIIVDEDHRGLILDATGSFLFAEFERALPGGLSESPPSLATQLADGLVEQFELAAAVDPDIDTGDGRATFAVRESAFGDPDRIDHPVVSFLAVGFAVALDQPVSVEVAAGDGREDWLVTCRWDTDSG